MYYRSFYNNYLLAGLRSYQSQNIVIIITDGVGFALTIQKNPSLKRWLSVVSHAVTTDEKFCRTCRSE